MSQLFSGKDNLLGHSFEFLLHFGAFLPRCNCFSKLLIFLLKKLFISIIFCILVERKALSLKTPKLHSISG